MMLRERQETASESGRMLSEGNGDEEQGRSRSVQLSKALGGPDHVVVVVVVVCETTLILPTATAPNNVFHEATSDLFVGVGCHRQDSRKVPWFTQKQCVIRGTAGPSTSQHSLLEGQDPTDAEPSSSAKYSILLVAVLVHVPSVVPRRLQVPGREIKTCINVC
jgi:hypothetical protein